MQDRIHALLFPALLTIPALAGIAALVFVYLGVLGLWNAIDTPFILRAATVVGISLLYFLPGAGTGSARDLRLAALAAVFLYGGVGLNLLHFQNEIWFQAVALTCAVGLIAGVALFYDLRHELERSIPYKPLIFCALALAAIFGLMTCELLSGAVSGRIAVTGKGALAMTCIAAACAFYGPRFPRLYWLLMGLTLFYIWLALPAVGLEAYSRHIMPDAPPLTEEAARRFYQSGWKWLLGFCAAGLAAGVYLLILCLAMRRRLRKNEQGI